jgi:hypothetical protein
MTGARSGTRTHIPFRMRDFKSLASTGFAIRAERKKAQPPWGGCALECDGGRGRNRTGVRGFAVRCMTTLPPGHRLRSAKSIRVALKKQNPGCPRFCGITWSGKRDSNSRPRPWQGRALPTELFPRRCPAILDQMGNVSTTLHRFFFTFFQLDRIPAQARPGGPQVIEARPDGQYARDDQQGLADVVQAQRLGVVL